MKRITLLLLASLVLFGSCKKEDSPPPSTNNTGNNNNNGNNTGDENNDNDGDNTGDDGTITLDDNTFKIVKGNNEGELIVAINKNIICGGETDNSGSFHSFRGFFSYDSSNYDRLSVGFKSEPADGVYEIDNAPDYYSLLAAGKSGVNITFDGNNYKALGGKVYVRTVSGNKLVFFNDIALGAGTPVIYPGPLLPEGSLISGVIVCR